MRKASVRQSISLGLAWLIAVAGVGLAKLAWATPIVTALYDPANGNLTLTVRDNGAPATLAVSAFQILSPAQRLSGSTAMIPPAAISAFTVLNTDASAIYDPPRQFAEIYANGLGGTLFNSTWNLGNVAQAGLSQADLNAGFSSNGDVLPPAQPGKFLYESNATWLAGEIVAVPEPGIGPLLLAGGVFIVARALRRRVGWTRPARPGRAGRL